MPATVSRSKKWSNVAKKDNSSARNSSSSTNTGSLYKTNFTCSACEQRRKWCLKLTLVRLQTWSLMALGEGMKILCIKDHIKCTNIMLKDVGMVVPKIKETKL